MNTTFSRELASVAEAISVLLHDPALRPELALEELRDAVLAYPFAGGKAMRPALITWACRALGGEETVALRAGLAVELYHTFSLVHDDVIDRDPMRRGRPSVHVLLDAMGRRKFNLEEDAAHYGLSMAILAGDWLQCWAIDLLGSLPEMGVTPQVALALIRRLQGQVGPAILEGEARDIQLPFLPVEQVTDAEILRMIRCKTAALFAYCAWTGGMLARGVEDADVRALAAFAEGSGIAFQLQDDVLGLTADEATLGKPVGNDLREGKRTLIIAHAWQRATPEERAQLAGVLGNGQATPEAIDEAIGLLHRLGVIEHVRALAGQYLDDAMRHLDRLPRNDGTALLRELALKMVRREK